MMHGMSGPLVTSAVGYWILTASEKEKGRVKKAGQILALVVILVSLGQIACGVISFARARGYCPAGAMSCPFSGKAAPSQPGQ